MSRLTPAALPLASGWQSARREQHNKMSTAPGARSCPRVCTERPCHAPRISERLQQRCYAVMTPAKVSKLSGAMDGDKRYIGSGLPGMCWMCSPALRSGHIGRRRRRRARRRPHGGRRRVRRRRRAGRFRRRLSSAEVDCALRACRGWCGSSRDAQYVQRALH